MKYSVQSLVNVSIENHWPDLSLPQELPNIQDCVGLGRDWPEYHQVDLDFAEVTQLICWGGHRVQHSLPVGRNVRDFWLIGEGFESILEGWKKPISDREYYHVWAWWACKV